MKKLITTLNNDDSFNKKLREQRNKQFFERVRKTGAYYHVKEWEEDYKRQLAGQKFMRQVTYTRPKDWKDPFAEKPKEEKPKRGANREKSTFLSTGTSRKSATSHVSRVKGLRQSRVSESKHPAESEATGGTGPQRSHTDSEVEKGVSDAEGELPSRLLASMERKIIVTFLDENAEHQERPSSARERVRTSSAGDHAEVNMSASTNALFHHPPTAEKTTPYEIDVSIFCSLVEDRVLYITVDGVDDVRVHAEAQIDVGELFGGGMDANKEDMGESAFPTDPEAQDSIAFDVISEISLGLENGNEYCVLLPDPSRLASETESQPPDIDREEVTTEDAKQILEKFDPVFLCCGVSAPVEVFHPRTNKPELSKQKSGHRWGDIKVFKPEKISLLLKIMRIGEEKAVIKAHVVRDSINKFNGALRGSVGKSAPPAVRGDSTMELQISLPSILSIESELILDYFRNAASSVRIQHNSGTGENIILLE
eukprot:CAMPEP_0185027448 /NCGR_PEP_ID=MMETSP1103-20130426/12512_1 /TAXON_ID=36769 /ORGANISM="Paraphysomonas bandaiensis, Strain Caron Lab Isolate" /LENGTH=481 /DNA_ID=CAMNT_0027561449 /DNA_START=406 /DNA_END=1851 /DNA_ORIENTATION=+